MNFSLILVNDNPSIQPARDCVEPGEKPQNVNKDIEIVTKQIKCSIIMQGQSIRFICPVALKH